MTRLKETKGIKIFKRVFVIILALSLGFGCVVFIQANRFKSRLEEMFRLNRELQEQNYYMAEFEYRLKGIGYLLDKGQYGKSLYLFNQYYQQLKSRDGLVKLPRFHNPKEELEFYLNLQNPTTGAFMDDAYPMCVYHGPTENVLNHIEKLAQEAGTPIKLKYRLTYLDQINTPEKLIDFLNDVSTVGFIASKMPQTSFHTARDILTLARDKDAENLVEKYNLYYFSPEWKRTMLRWFYGVQDQETGLWGPKSKSGKLLMKDLNNTSSILKAFRDNDRNNIHKEFPLRYVDQLVSSAMETLSEPPPLDDDLAWAHEWNLKTVKSLRLMTRYLWKDISSTRKKRIAELFKEYIRINCEKYYIPEEGAFSYYPNSEHATMDGAIKISIFKEIGALSSEKQQFLWGRFEDTAKEGAVIKASQLTNAELRSIAEIHDINSFRFYRDNPDADNLFSGARAVFYPRPTSVPDIMELTRGMKQFLATTELGMGNWTSKADVSEQLQPVVIPEDIIFSNALPDTEIREILAEKGELAIIGFDLLQVPRFRLVVR